MTASRFMGGSSIHTTPDPFGISGTEGVQPGSHLSPTLVWPDSSRNVLSPLRPRGSLAKGSSFYSSGNQDAEHTGSRMWPQECSSVVPKSSHLRAYTFGLYIFRPKSSA